MKALSACFKSCLKQLDRDDSGRVPPPFGEEMRQQEFLLEPGKVFLNHGSFGAVSRPVFEAQKRLQDEMDWNPDVFFREQFGPLRDASRSAIAKFVGASLNNLTLVENTTTGIGNVLISLKLAPGEAILYNNLTYGAVKNAVTALLYRSPGAKSLVMQYQIPITSSDAIVQQYAHMLDQYPEIKIAVIDHISESAILFPVLELVSVCKSRGVLVVIDGAHCPGHINLNLESIGADFYIGNLHKWLYSPRGCTIQWVAPQHHHLMRPAVASFNYMSTYPRNFEIFGTRDNTPLCTVPDLLGFCDWIGGIKAQEAYAEEIWQQVLPMLTSAWQTLPMDIPADMRAPFFRCIELPPLPGYPLEPASPGRLMQDVYNKYGVRSYFLFVDGSLYTRMSVNIYVTVEDFVRLRDAILDMMEKKLL